MVGPTLEIVSTVVCQGAPSWGVSRQAKPGGFVPLPARGVQAARA